MRYCYQNKAYIAAGATHGVLCEPVRDPETGRCLAYGGKQRVRFWDGWEAVVIRRRLRVRERACVNCKLNLCRE